MGFAEDITFSGHGPAVLWPERQQLKNLSEEKEQMLNKKCYVIGFDKSVKQRKKRLRNNK